MIIQDCSDKVGLIIDRKISLPKLDYLFREVDRRHNLDLNNMRLTYYLPSKEFCFKYSLNSELVDYLMQKGKDNYNFWNHDNDTFNPFLTAVVISDLKKMVDYITARDGLLIFFRDGKLPDWYMHVFRYAVSLQKSRIREVAVD